MPRKLTTDGCTEAAAEGEDEPEAADGPEWAMDFDEYCRQLTARTDAKLEVIKKEHNEAILSLGKKMQQHMKQTQIKMDKLSAQVDESREHTERVRLQVISAAHQADARWTEASKKHDSFEAKVDALSSLMASLPPAVGSAQAPRAGSSGGYRAPAGPPRGGGADPTSDRHTGTRLRTHGGATVRDSSAGARSGATVRGQGHRRRSARREQSG